MKIFGFEITQAKSAASTSVVTVQPEPVTKNTTGYTPGSLNDPSWNSALTFGAGWYPSNTGETISHYYALQNPTVVACVRAISSDIASLGPAILYRHLDKGGKQIVREHPCVDLLNDPNPWQTNEKFMSTFITSLVLRGNAFAWIRRAGDGTPTQLIPLLADRVVVLRNLDEPGQLIYQFTSEFFAGEVMRCGQEDMLHVRNPLTIDDGGILGASPITYGQQTLGLALALMKSSAIIFKQGAQIRGVLKSPTKLGKEFAERIASSWNKIYSGNENAHKVAVLEEGLEFQPVSMTAKDAQTNEQRLASDNEICRMFGVPPHRAQILDRATYSNIEQQYREYVDNTLRAVAVAFEQELAKKCLFKSERRTLFFRLNFDEINRADTDKKFTAISNGVINGFVTPNEARAIIGFNPDPDGNKLRFQMNTTPLGVANDSNKPTEDDPSPEPDEEEEDQ